MRPYQRAIDKLSRFKELLQQYWSTSTSGRFTPQEEARQSALRERINQSIDEVRLLIHHAGVRTEMFYSPPPAVGGVQGDIDLITNVFNLSSFQIPKSAVVDQLDRAIGNYQFYRKRFYRRLFNPLYWLGELIRIPFRLLDFAGFDADKFELSLLGKLYKLVAGLLGFVWIVLQLLDYFGYSFRTLFN